MNGIHLCFGIQVLGKYKSNLLNTKQSSVSQMIYFVKIIDSLNCMGIEKTVMLYILC